MAGHTPRRNTVTGRDYCIHDGEDWPCPALTVVDGPSALANAWKLVAACPHKDTDDGTCHHPNNVTPECHEGACPYAQ